LAIERLEKPLAQRLAVIWQIVEQVIGLAGQSRGRHIEEADQIKAHRPVDHAAQQLGALQLRRMPGGDAFEKLMQPVAIGESVVCGLPVRMLVGGAEPGDAQCRGIGERTAEIGCSGTGAQRRRQCRDDPLGIVGEQLPGQLDVRSPPPALGAAGRQQIRQFGRRRLAQSHQIERMTPRIQLLTATGADQLIDDGRQHQRRLLPTDDVEAFECLVDEVEGVAAIGEGAIGDGGQQQCCELGRRGPAGDGRQEGALGAVAMADLGPMP
jgi:hypothetical protein